MIRAVLAAAAMLLSAPTAGTVAAVGDTTSCPGTWVSCAAMPATPDSVVGQKIVAGAQNPGTPWLITDKNGAPMAWVNLYGLYSGGDGNAMPGGLICVTYGVLKTSACLTPVGTLTLTPTDTSGPTGPTETLTAHDIGFVHCLELNTPYYCRTALAAGKF